MMKKTPIMFAMAIAGIGTATALSLVPKPAERFHEPVNVSPNGRILDKDSQAPHRKTPINPPTVGVEAPEGKTWECGFDTKEEFESFTVINANEDANKWQWSDDEAGGGYASIGYNSSIAMDDWLISPAIHLESGSKYVISVEARCSSTNYPERIGVYIGQGREVADATTTLVEPAIVRNGNLAAFGNYFTPGQTGDYHIMIHGCSDADMSTLVIDNIKVSSPGAKPIPGEDAIRYKEVVLLDQDFSSVPGSEESPVAIEGEGHYLDGLEGWRGLDVYGIGGAVMIDNINGTSGWSQLAPPKASFTNESAEEFMGRVILEAKVVEFSGMASELGNFEGVNFTGMAGSTECPNGWIWGGNDSDFVGWFTYGGDGDWTTFDSAIKFGGAENLLDDDFNNPDAIIELGTYTLDQFSARITPMYGSNLAIRRYKVVEMIPEVPTVQTWAITGYDADGFTISWDAVEGADRYIVDLYEGDARLSTLTRIGRCDTDRPSATFDVKTDDGRFLYVNMFACSGDMRSPLSPMRRIFATNTPSFGPLEAPADGSLSVPFTSDPTAHALEVYALGGLKNTEAVKDYEVAHISFAGFKDSEADDNTPHTLGLDSQEAGWLMYPAASFEDGAFKCNNSMATWGYTDFMTVAGHSAYDFSEVDGDIKVAVTARTEGNCMITVNLKAFDPTERYFMTYASDSKTISSEYDTYEFRIDPQGRDNVYIEVTTGGQDTNYIKDITVTCDLPAGATFLRPFLVGELNIEGKNISSGRFSLDIPDGIGKVRVTGQARRGLVDLESNTLYYNARSLFSEPAEIEFEPNSVGLTEDDVERSQPVFLNLQGIRMEGELHPGVYIKVNGDKSEKIIIR